MKYKIFIACILTAIATAFTTAYVIEHKNNISPAVQKTEDKTYDPAAECPDKTAPNEYGCCAGETYTDMGDLGYNCCPDSGGDCFPPIKKQ